MHEKDDDTPPAYSRRLELTNIAFGLDEARKEQLEMMETSLEKYHRIKSKSK